MPQSPEQPIVIHAIIPHPTDRRSILVTPEGTYPSIQFESDVHHTYEGALHALGREALGAVLSVDRRAVEVEASNFDIAYETKPPKFVSLDSETKLRWSDLSE